MSRLLCWLGLHKWMYAQTWAYDPRDGDMRACMHCDRHEYYLSGYKKDTGDWINETEYNRVARLRKIRRRIYR